MKNTKDLFMHYPGGEHESGNLPVNNNEDEITNSDQPSELKKGKKTIIDKVRDALQEWSNADREDQEFDDTRP